MFLFICGVFTVAGHIDRIQIHPMFLFITFVPLEIDEEKDSNTSHVFIYPESPAGKDASDSIQIHPMFLFIRRNAQSKEVL